MRATQPYSLGGGGTKTSRCTRNPRINIVMLLFMTGDIKTDARSKCCLCKRFSKASENVVE